MDEMTQHNAALVEQMNASIEQTEGPLDGEGGELPGLPRLRLPFNRRSFGRLRLLIDAVNQG